MQLHYLIYLDILLAVCLGIFFTIDGYFFYKQQIKKQKLLTEDYVIAKEMEEFENIDIALHDGNVYEAQIHKEIENQQDLQDYITKWCHEIRIPLSACLLMNEKMEDAVLKQQIKEQLERMNQLLNAALVGCKVQSSLYDLQIKKVDVKDCVQTSIKNNRFFLIQNHFDIFVEIQDACVYSDKEWLVYVLDQLMSNAIKYAKNRHEIHIWTENRENTTILFFEDHGEGIQDVDIRRIFEKGYTGNNHHNGKYKSTGMGLYMVMLIMKKLGHEIQVESEFGNYTRFSITFHENKDYFLL